MKSQTITLCEPVRWFAEEMQKKLNANAHKDEAVGQEFGWRGPACGYPELLKHLRNEEIDELVNALSSCDWPSVIQEAADVANMAMMIADRARTKNGGMAEELLDVRVWWNKTGKQITCSLTTVHTVGPFLLKKRADDSTLLLEWRGVFVTYNADFLKNEDPDALESRLWEYINTHVPYYVIKQALERTD